MNAPARCYWSFVVTFAVELRQKAVGDSFATGLAVDAAAAVAVVVVAQLLLNFTG